MFHQLKKLQKYLIVYFDVGIDPLEGRLSFEHEYIFFIVALIFNDDEVTNLNCPK